ncbi:MAG: membrane protein insertion efficiency factor YidD [Desulfuromonadales bacterium]|nr:membrane protein insertion efficiency factor YidD [Desulfuromonadales bacterium]
MFKSSLLLAIRLYQRLLSPLLPQTCRFYPSCSEYSRESIQRHGFVKGLRLTVQRLGKCHPFHAGGYDPVP